MRPSERIQQLVDEEIKRFPINNNFDAIDIGLNAIAKYLDEQYKPCKGGESKPCCMFHGVETPCNHQSYLEYLDEQHKDCNCKGDEDEVCCNSKLESTNERYELCSCPKCGWSQCTTTKQSSKVTVEDIISTISGTCHERDGAISYGDTKIIATAVFYMIEGRK